MEQETLSFKSANWCGQTPVIDWQIGDVRKVFAISAWSNPTEDLLFCWYFPGHPSSQLIWWNDRYRSYKRERVPRGRYISSLRRYIKDHLGPRREKLCYVTLWFTGKLLIEMSSPASPQLSISNVEVYVNFSFLSFCIIAQSNFAILWLTSW